MQVVKPRAIEPGGGIGIVATSSPVSAERLDLLVSRLAERGYGVRVAAGATDRFGYLAGLADRRARGVMEMFADPEVSLVLPANGGSGAAHLVDLLDYTVITENPKLFAGFSDPTVLNNAILATTGLASVHGVSGFDFLQDEVDPVTEAAFWAMVSGRITGRDIVGTDWRVHRSPGTAVSGPVIGGNLYAFGALAGTRWMPEVEGAVMLVEAMDATFEHIDAALTHLRLTGAFDDIAALVLGAPADWIVDGAADADVDALVLRSVGGNFPVVTNVGYGHRPDKLQFPIGCRIELDLTAHPPVLRYLEDLVRV